VKTINVIGCGRVGKTLARLGTEQGIWEVRCVLNRSLASAARAVEFVGAGRAVEDYTQLERADAVMISARDEAIEACCRQLCEAGVVDQGVKRCDGKWWPYPALAYLQGRKTADQLLREAAAHPGRLAKAHAYIGLTLARNGDRKGAHKHLGWVINSGFLSHWEYAWARTERRRLAGGR